MFLNVEKKEAYGIMLTEFELQEAQFLKNEIEQSMLHFVLNPEIEKYIKRLGELSKRCEHKYLNGECVYCGKPEK